MKKRWLPAAMAIAAIALLETSVVHAGPRDAGGEEKRSVNTLRLYGPGGPLGPMKECADKFSEKTGTEISITTGTPPQWIEQAEQNGDLIFEGAEYMLNDFMQSHPGIVDEASITGLYARAAAILVRHGNPKHIATLDDLAKAGTKIMVVTLEKMEEVYGRVPGIQYNIVKPVLTGREAARNWKTMPELDAWITYESWGCALADDTDIIQIPEENRVLRITPIAMLNRSKNKKLGMEFIKFLRSGEVHRIFQTWGWK